MIFDFDGTLADSFRMAYQVFNKLSGPFHYHPVAEDEIETMRQKTASDFFSSLGISVFKIPLLAIKARRELRGHIASVPPIKGMPDVLPLLQQQGCKMGILTSNSVKNVQSFLRAHHLEDFFEFTYCSRDMFGKARHIKKLIRKYNLDPAHVIYVGDMNADIEAAQQAGIRIAAVTWGYQAREVLERYHPTWLLDTPAQLAELIRGE